MNSVLRKISRRIKNSLYIAGLRKAGVKISRRCSVSDRCHFEGRNNVLPGTILSDVVMGFGSYIGKNAIFVKTKIGRYCSIADGVQIVRGQHPHRTCVSTHPAFYSTDSSLGFTYVNTQKFEENRYVDADCHWSLVIGNDVWIGTGVMLMEGITIGDGAVLAAGSVVTKDVTPYSIVGGVPAKHLSYRFDESVISRLLEIKWWDKSEEYLKQNADMFMDIQRFIDQV